MTRPVHVNIKMTRREVPKFMVVHTHTHFYLLVKKISTLLILIFVADCVPHIYTVYVLYVYTKYTYMYFSGYYMYVVASGKVALLL